jgi:outer membrane receptor protein involved in Fe transport
VTAERLKGKELVDRTIYSVPAQIANTSNNGYDILKKIPQVTVDYQNNITLNGSSNFIIQVDGRQRDKEFLAKLLPSDIENIEIITNPSGKYEGNIDGVINIILKKEARYGINGSVSAQIKPFLKPTDALVGSLDYSMGKITFYVTGTGVIQKLDIGSKNYSSFKTVDSLSNSIGKGKISTAYASINSGFDYFPNAKNMFSLNVNYTPVNQNVKVGSNADLLKNNVVRNTMTSASENDMQSNEFNISLFYKKTFAKSVQELTSEINYYHFTSDNTSDFKNNRYNYDPEYHIGSLDRNEFDDDNRNYIMAKMDYTQPLGLSAKLETGYQFYYQKLDYNFTINHDAMSDNFFRYQELRNSVYAGVTLNLKKFGFQAMLRVENSNINADSVTEPNYSCLLPSANVQYKISASHNIKFTYNRRITRPGIFDMNPYWKIGSSYDVSEGNPDLKPEYRDRLQLTYTWNFGNNYFSPNIYYEYLSNRIGRKYQYIESPIDGSLTTFTKPYNLLTGYEYGGGVTAMLWLLNINARLYKGHFDKYVDQAAIIPARDYFSYAITGTVYVPLTKDKKTVVYSYLSYNGLNMNAQTKTYTKPLYALGAQKQVKDHSFGFFYLFPLSKELDYQKTETSTSYYYSKNITSVDFSWFVEFIYSYKFNKGKNVKKSNRSLNIESDSKKTQIGM